MERKRGMRKLGERVNDSTVLLKSCLDRLKYDYRWRAR